MGEGIYSGSILQTVVLGFDIIADTPVCSTGKLMPTAELLDPSPTLSELFFDDPTCNENENADCIITYSLDQKAQDSAEL